MNFFLPVSGHVWVRRKYWNKCRCGCEEYVELNGKVVCLEKLKLMLDEKGYVLSKKVINTR